ncbi:coil containing protein [Vibrio phage 1.049.O._10N.286.54.B5]|nr:coil containing protein [Vibrio phage 1.049.O._10N.286.54.B5]AUR84190.1 hypothetical protein NVP1050O_21 [Vibrio phage 1.050.O._10N.286.48.A6]
MTITRDKLKIFKPELLGTSDEAGGQRTRNVVQSGKLNELFRAISDIDHAQSSLDIVKCYPGVDTQDTSTLLDGHVFISEPPTDELVSMLLVESSSLDDDSRMVEMKEILESGVTAGDLITEGAPGFLPNQNTFSRDYLGSTHTGNYRVTNLRVGQVICITVEYDGTLDAKWPRIQHYCVVTDTNAPGTDAGNVVFDPPIDVATPDAGTSINGQGNCTKLRLVNETSPMKFHGVSKLTASANGKVLAVNNTTQNLIPIIIAESIHSGIKLAPTGIVKKSVTTPSSAAQTYQFQVSDTLQGTNQNVDYYPEVSFISGGVVYGSEDAVILVGSTSVDVTLSRKPDLNTIVTLSYISSAAYQNYSNDDPFPADRKLVPGSIFGVVLYNGTSYIMTEYSGSVYIKVDGTIPGGSWENELRAGIVDYDNGTIALEADFSTDTWVGLVEDTTILITTVNFLLSVSEPILDTFYVQVSNVSNVTLSGSSDSSGVITGSGVSGTIVNNFVSLTFNSSVKLDTLSYDVTELVHKLPPTEIYDLNPIRIANGGVVDIYKVWGTVSVQHTQYQAVDNPVDGKTMTIRTGARFVDITDKDGTSLWTPTDDNYIVDAAAGTVTIKSTFAGFNAPFVLGDSIGELALVTDFDETSVSLASDLTREYPLGSTVSSVQILGDMQARVGKVRDMTSWDGNWDVDGTPADSNMNTVDYPIEVTNETATNEDWVLVFTSATAFTCTGKRLGQIGSGDTLNDFAPINSITNSPFFVIRNEAFGAGWSAGEAIRFETFASADPIMAIRTVQAGHSQITTDRTVLAFRGNES